MWPVKANQSQSRSATSTGMCTALWLPSTSTGMPRACAMRQISLIGVTVPSAFDMCVMATSFVLAVRLFSKSSIWKAPRSSTGTHTSFAPCRSRMKCHGTMLEWCSMMESTISSPAPMFGMPQP